MFGFTTCFSRQKISLYQWRNLFRGDRSAEEVTLNSRAIDSAEYLHLLLRFHPFRYHPAAQGVGRPDDGTHQDRGVWVIQHVDDEQTVQLQTGDRQMPEGSQ